MLMSKFIGRGDRLQPAERLGSLSRFGPSWNPVKARVPAGQIPPDTPERAAVMVHLGFGSTGDRVLAIGTNLCPSPVVDGSEGDPVDRCWEAGSGAGARASGRLAAVQLGVALPRGLWSRGAGRAPGTLSMAVSVTGGVGEGGSAVV